jgi:Flp pilus assembly protein TadD
MSVSAVPLRGKLEEHSFTAVLRALLRERRDGCLTVARGAITRRLYLRGGMIIYGSSTERQDRLGEILVAQGKLSKADHRKYWDQSKAGNRLLGITLLVNDRITLSDLYQGVTAQVVTILDRLQKWRKGDYDFEEGREPAAGTVLLRIPLALYLRTDPEKKTAATRPAATKPAATKTAATKPATRSAPRKKGAAAAPPPAAPGPAADQPRPPGVGGDGEQVFEIVDETAAEEVISAEAVREMECVGEVSFLVQELRKRVGQDPFALLGVPPEADHAAVQAAYHRIAKVLHPDRLPKGCTPDLAHEADEIYREVTAASQTAAEELRRRSDAASAGAPTAQQARPAPSADDQSRRFFAQGREWISKRNYWQAADALRQAVRLKPAEATYRQYLGLALMQTKRMHEAEEHLVEATRLEPNNPAHFVNLGRIYRGGRLYKKAREAFERALRVDPRDEHARDELSDLPEEQPPGRKPESGGILKKLFGKG